jgi:hypothetical protein
MKGHDMKERFLILLLLWGGVELSAQTILQQFAAISKGSGLKSDMDVEPTAKGSTLIGMPGQLSPGVKVLSVTDNAPDGGNTYKQVSGARSSCPQGPLDIWYCENCNPGVTELQFHLSGHVKASINSFLEVSNLASSSILDGSGAQVSDGSATSAGLEVGPRIRTTATDFIVARFFSASPYPTGVTPAAWTFKPSYVYVLNGPPGTYQPTLTGGKDRGSFCMSVAAFKTAPSVATPQPDHN